MMMMMMMVMTAMFWDFHSTICSKYYFHSYHFHSMIQTHLQLLHGSSELYYSLQEEIQLRKVAKLSASY